MRTTPEDGDITMRAEVREGTLVFVLRAVPGPDQFILPARETALVRARTVARRRGVRVWLADSDGPFTLLEDVRSEPAESA